MGKFSGAADGNRELERALTAFDSGDFAGLTTGNVYVVIEGDSSNYVQFVNQFQKVYDDGTEKIQTSLDNAMAACTANRGDYVYIAPGYTLAVTTTVPALDVAGVTIIGLGNGLDRPTFTYAGDDSTITVTAANIKMINCHHTAGDLDVASAYTLAAAKDFELLDCTFDDATDVLNFLSIVTTNATDQAAEGLTVLRNRWNGLNTTPLAFVSILAATDRLKIGKNVVYSDATNDIGHFISLSSKIILEADIFDNILVVVGATNASVGIFLTGSDSNSKGIVRDNLISSLDTGSEIIATTGTGLVFFNNKYTGVADKSGYVLPEIDTSA